VPGKSIVPNDRLAEDGSTLRKRLSVLRERNDRLAETLEALLDDRSLLVESRFATSPRIFSQQFRLDAEPRTRLAHRGSRSQRLHARSPGAGQPVERRDPLDASRASKTLVPASSSPEPLLMSKE